MTYGSGELTLDEMYDWLERMPVPEGHKSEIVGGHIFLWPLRDTHWDIIADIYDQLRAKYPRKRVKSDVRMDCPGYLNGFAPDVVALAEGARKDDRGHWRPDDVEFVAEVVSRSTAGNDHGPRRTPMPPPASRCT